MPFRRREPLHDRLAREGGLRADPYAPHRVGPRWGEVGIHGVHRQREWDTVAVAEAPALAGEEREFVVLPDGTLLVEDGDDADAEALAPLADAVEESLHPPYRARAVPRERGLWAVAANAIRVAELGDDVPGDSLELAVHGGETTLTIDGAPAWGSLPVLERLAAERHESYVARAERLDGPLWEVEIEPL
jgi:hypothetical protein